MKIKLIYHIFLWSAVLCTSVLYSQTGWINRNPQPQNDFYSIKFFNQNTGYAIGSNGIILKTYTGDNQWTSQSSGTTKNLYGSYFFDMNHGIVVGDSGVVLNTINGGNSWTTISSGTLNALRSVTFVNSNTGFSVGDNGTVLKTINGGLNWTISNPVSQHLNSIFFIDANTGFACGESGTILKTTDSGINWNSQNYSGSMRSIYFVNSNTGYIGSNLGPQLKTIDGGSTWNNFLTQYTGGIYSIKFMNTNTGFAVGRGNPICKTTNGGANWFPWCSFQLWGDYIFRDINIIDTNTFFVCGEKGWLLKCTGTYNSQISTHLGGTKSNLSFVSFANENIGMVIGSNQYLNTFDGGTKWNVSCVGDFSWFEYSRYIIGAWMFSPQSIYRLYNIPGHAGPASFFLENSTDGGITWNGTRTYSMGGSLGGVCEIEGVSYLSDYELAVIPSKVKKNTGSGWVDVYSSTAGSLGQISFSNQNTGAVIINNPGSSIMRTVNGGNTWSVIPTGSTKNLFDIQFLPSGIAYLTGDSSFIQRSTDFGASWANIPGSTNDSYINVQFINDYTGWILAYQNRNYYTPKLLYTNNGGSSLIQIQSLGNFGVRGMSFINALTGYVCGDSGVVLKTTDAGLTFVNPISNISPKQFSLSQNYPNPFNPTTNIKFDLPKSGFVKLTIYDALGREVTTLVNSEMKAGSYNADWDASNFSSGIYFYKLVVDDFTETKKMVLIK